MEQQFADVDWKHMLKQSRLKQKDLAKWLNIEEAYFSKFLAGEKSLKYETKVKLKMIFDTAIETVTKIEALCEENKK